MATFIESLLERLLATSLQAAALVAVIWMLCRCVPRLSPATQCWLWWLVALQVLLGLIAVPVHLPWLPNAGEAGPILPATGDMSPAAASTGATAIAEATPLTRWQLAAFGLWMTGLALMAWSTARDWLRARQLLAQAVPCTDRETLDAVARCAAERGLRRVPRLFTTRVIGSPAIVGGFHPALLLPAGSTLSGAQLEMAVAHELAHLRRHDLWWGIIPTLARHVLFFHPLVHLAVREYGIAREAACDASVVEGGQGSRRDYGELLLKLGTQQSGADLAAASTTFRALSRRLTLLQHGSFLPRACSILVLILVVGGITPMRLVAAAAEPAAAPAQPVMQANSRPRVLSRPDPRDYYPAESRSQGELGTVEVRLCYDEKGAVIDSTLATSSGFSRLDEAAVRAGRRYRIRPAVASGAALPDCMVLPITYKAEALQIETPTAARYSGTPINADFQQIPVRTLLLLIAETSGRTIVVDDSVTGTVTLRVENVPWDQVLDIVLSTKGLEKREQGNRIIVAAAGAK